MKRWSLPLALVALALFFRFADLPNVRHSYDNAYQQYLALQMIDGRMLLRVGQPSSVFLDNPPLMAYLQTIPLLIWRSLWSPYIFVTFLNSIAVWFVYDMTCRLFDRTTAVIAAILFAINPWLVHYSRMTWTQGLQPFLMVVIAWGVWKALIASHTAAVDGPSDAAAAPTPTPTERGIQENPKLSFLQRQEAILLIGLLAAVALTQTYILGFAILAPLGSVLLLSWRNVSKRALLIAGGVFGVCMAVFLSGVLGVERSAENSEKTTAFLEQLTIEFNPQAITHALRFVTGVNYDGQDPYLAQVVATPLLSSIATISLATALCAGVLFTVYQWRKTRSQILLVWFGLGAFGTALIPLMVHPHYLLLTLPAGHLLAAFGLRPLWDWRWTRPILVMGLLLFGMQFKLNLWRAGAQVVAAPLTGDFRAWRLDEAVRFGKRVGEVSADIDSSPLTVAADSHPAVLSSLASRWIEIQYDTQFPNFVRVPADAAMLYINRGLLPEVDSTPVLTDLRIEQRFYLSDGSSFQFATTQPHDRATAAALPKTQLNLTSQAGLTLLGYTHELSGNLLNITTWWRADSVTDERANWFMTVFYQLVNGDGQMLVNQSPHGIWGYRWQQDDLLIERTQIAIPTDAVGELSLRFGLYDPIHNLNFELDGVGQTFAISLTP